jgi:hypothetical protein
MTYDINREIEKLKYAYDRLMDEKREYGRRGPKQKTLNFYQKQISKLEKSRDDLLKAIECSRIAIKRHNSENDIY